MKKVAKKVLSPTEILLKKIDRQFSKKRLIGDIEINENEYALLMGRLRVLFNRLQNSSDHDVSEISFAVALVQIGIRYYDGGFWPHVAKELGIKYIPTHQTVWLGESFYRILVKSNKLRLKQGEWVNNILMHCFVTDYYAENLFNFLFAYYRIDLERDLLRNNRQMMNTLIETMLKNDNTGRTYWLVRHTSDALRVNTKGTKIRLRRLLRLIDKCFWEQTTPSNSTNRITQLFFKWQNNSNDFNQEYARYHGVNSLGHGKKSFSTPSLQCNFKEGFFRLLLPTQLINFNYNEDIYWLISFEEIINRLKTNLYQGVTGHKTEETHVELETSNLFTEYNISLMCGNIKLRRFKIKADNIRFFDKNGDYLHTENLPSGELYAFSPMGSTPVSKAIINSERIGDMLLTYFDFQYGDIVRLPDGKPISIGKKVEEGLLPRGIIHGAYVLNDDEEQIVIYKKAPTLLLKTLPTRTNGTLIQVNGNNYRMFDQDTLEIDLDERSEEKGYIIDTSDFGCLDDGVYHIAIDVPNDRSQRIWNFTLIDGFGFEFEDAPYIFSPRGTIRFTDNLKIIAKRGSEKLPGENAFNFEINPNSDDIMFDVLTESTTIPLRVFAPVFKWKFDNEDWQIHHPPEIWHNDFPSIIYIKYPDDFLSICMDEDSNYESPEQTQSYKKIKEKHLFECDMTRFKSWFGREVTIRSVILQFGNIKRNFISVVTKSTVTSCIIRGDYGKDLLIGHVEIIGKARYYADIKLNNKLLAEKIVISEGRFEWHTELISGKYSIDIFEEDDDGTGFGEVYYFPVAHFDQDLLNPHNLSGKCFQVKRIKKGEDSSFYLRLNYKFTIENLRLADGADKHRYTGQMFVDNSLGQYGKLVASYPVNAHFYNTNKLKNAKLTFSDDGEDEVFLYDYNRYIIVKEENRELPRTVRYRRFIPLYSDEYIFEVDFIEPSNRVPDKIPEDIPIDKVKKYSSPKQPEQKVKDLTVFTKGFWQIAEEGQYSLLSEPVKKGTNMVPYLKPLEDLGLTQRTYNCLKRAGFKTAGDIANQTYSSLMKVRNLGRRSLEEAILKINVLGLDLKEV